jgi:hypothetical protein
LSPNCNRLAAHIMKSTFISSKSRIRGRLAMITIGALLALAPGPRAEIAPPSSTTIVAAAEAFLATLDERQKSKVLFGFDDEKQRKRWSNLPVSFVPRGGLSLGELSQEQKTAALAILSSALSESGYKKVLEIMEGDERLRVQSGNRQAPSGLPSSMFGKDLYYVSILGKPSAKEPWMIQFGGHHLALNLTLAGSFGILTPSLTGVQPALYTENGRAVRPLGPENDKAFALLESLDEGERAQAILKFRVADLVLGPGHDGETIEAEGLKASAMNEEQRAMLLDLIAQWAGIARDDFAKARMEEIKAGLDSTWFAWSGPTTHESGKNGTAYYRIQGPKVVIEFAPQPLGGDRTMHLHTMYRDPTNDYGRSILRQ